MIAQGPQPHLDSSRIGEIKFDQADALVPGGERRSRLDVQVDQRAPPVSLQKRARDTESDVAAAAGDQNMVSIDIQQTLPVISVRPVHA